MVRLARPRVLARLALRLGEQAGERNDVGALFRNLDRESARASVLHVRNPAGSSGDSSPSAPPWWSAQGTSGASADTLRASTVAA